MVAANAKRRLDELPRTQQPVVISEVPYFGVLMGHTLSATRIKIIARGGTENSFRHLHAHLLLVPRSAVGLVTGIKQRNRGQLEPPANTVFQKIILLYRTALGCNK